MEPASADLADAIFRERVLRARQQTSAVNNHIVYNPAGPEHRRTVSIEIDRM